MDTAAKPPPRPISKSPFVDSTALLADPETLRKRAEDDGYLVFKRFLPADYVMELRAAIRPVTDQYGWRLPGLDWIGGLINPAVTAAIPDEEVGVWGTGVPCCRDVQLLTGVYRCPHHQISAVKLQSVSNAVWMGMYAPVTQMRAAVEVAQGVVVDIPVEKIAPTQIAVNHLHKQPNPHRIIR